MYCDILTQIKAARSALKSLELEVMEGHLKCCLMAAAKSGSENELDTKIKEIVDLIKRSSKYYSRVDVLGDIGKKYQTLTLLYRNRNSFKELSSL